MTVTRSIHLQKQLSDAQEENHILQERIRELEAAARSASKSINFSATDEIENIQFSNLTIEDPMQGFESLPADEDQRPGISSFLRSGLGPDKMDKKEAEKRLLAIDFESRPIDAVVLHNSIQSRVHCHREIKDPPRTSYDSPSFADERVRYLAYGPRRFLNKWQVGAPCPEEAILGLLDEYAHDSKRYSKGTIVLPVILDANQPLSQAVMARLAGVGKPLLEVTMRHQDVGDYLNRTEMRRLGYIRAAASSNPSIESPAWTVTRVMGIIRHCNAYSAFILLYDLEAQHIDANLYDLQIDKPLSSDCKKLLASLVGGCGRTGEVTWKFSKPSLDVSPLPSC
jgi:hypothetical protein